MFTGIVEEVGRVRSLEGCQLSIAARKVLRNSRAGDSLAVNGACLTVVELGRDTFSIDLMPETLRRTNLGSLKPGDYVNLERALTLSGRIGGHLVQGHIDGTGRVTSATPEGDAMLMEFQAPPQCMPYIVEKGFIAVDGVSLTVVSCRPDCFTVSLVSYTVGHTNLGRRQAGDLVNLEVDIIAKYVRALLQGVSPPPFRTRPRRRKKPASMPGE